jgi:hypothetical protein
MGLVLAVLLSAFKLLPFSFSGMLSNEFLNRSLKPSVFSPP